MTMTPNDDSDHRITARPGTAEYDTQFEEQALSAADGVLRHWFIRVPCAVFALCAAVGIIDGIFFSEESVLLRINSVFILTLAILEFGSIALRRRSFYFRFGLSGVREQG